MRKVIVLLMVTCLFAVPAAWGAEVLYGADGAGGIPSNLYILNPATGAIVSTVGPIGFAVTGLAIHPTTGVLYGSTGRRLGTATNCSAPGSCSLIRINPATGQGTLIGSYGVGAQTMADLTFTHDGTLYGWLEPGTDSLHTINLTTGLATLVGNSGLSTSGSGLAADASNTIYLAGEHDNGDLMTINRFTGQPTTVATLTGTTGNSVSALAFNSAGVLFGVVLAEDATRAANLVTINKTGQLTVLGPTVDNLDAIVFAGPAGPTHPIPTLSDVAVIIMAAMLGGMALLTLRRRGRQPQAT